MSPPSFSLGVTLITNHSIPASARGVDATTRPPRQTRVERLAHEASSVDSNADRVKKFVPRVIFSDPADPVKRAPSALISVTPSPG